MTIVKMDVLFKQIIVLAHVLLMTLTFITVCATVNAIGLIVPEIVSSFTIKPYIYTPEINIPGFFYCLIMLIS